MKKNIILIGIATLVLFLLLFLSISKRPAENDGMGDFFITVDNVKRHYYLYQPASAKSDVPLVIVLHGGAGDGKEIASISRMNETADAYGFAVAYPDGTGNSIAGKLFGTWNAGACCRPASEKKIDDVLFIDKMMDDIAGRISIDRHRVYVTGLSNGAQMTYRLACELSQKITAIAPIGGIAPLEDLPEACHPSRAVPIFHLHGELDPCVPISGGKCGGCFAKIIGQNPATDQWACDPLDTYLSKWMQRYSLTDSEKTSRDALRCSESAGKDTSIIQCIDPVAGHTWPGGTYGRVCDNEKNIGCQLIAKTLGPINPNISANELMWSFFKQYSLP